MERRWPRVGPAERTVWTQEIKNTSEEKRKFVTFVLSQMKLSTEHRKTKNKDKEKRIKEKTPRVLGPEDTTVHTRSEGPTVQLCGDSKVACERVNDEISQGTMYKETIGTVQKKNKNLHSWWKRKVAKPISNIDSFVKHVYREHHQEADHWANVGAQGRRNHRQES